MAFGFGFGFGSGGMVEFSPASLFAASEQGAWYEPESPATLGSRRNFLVYTEQFDSTAWTKVACTITANSDVAPDGTATADRITGDGVSSIHQAQQVSAEGAGLNSSVSVYLKQGTERYAYVYFLGRTPTEDTAGYTYIDLQTGTITGYSGGSIASTITSVGDGWYRCTSYKTSSYIASTQAQLAVGVANATNVNTSTASGYILAWGAQVEAGPTATTYQKVTDWNTEYLAAAGSAVTLFQDSAGTTPVTAVEQVVGKMLDKSGRGNHATQATTAQKPVLSARVNLLLATDTMATQSVTCLATSHVLSFTGTGTITLTGASTAGPLVGTGASNRVSLVFTPTAGSVTFTVSGSVTLAQLEQAAAVGVYQRVNTSTDYDTVGFLHYLKFDGVDDNMATSAITLSAYPYTLHAGAKALSNTLGGVVALWESNTVFKALSKIVTANAWDAKDTNVSALVNTETVGTNSTAHVLTGAFASGTVNLRMDATDPTSATANTNAWGTPTIIRIGMHGTALAPFTGHIYSLIIRGATSTAAQIATTENYVNTKTGAY